MRRCWTLRRPSKYGRSLEKAAISKRELKIVCAGLMVKIEYVNQLELETGRVDESDVEIKRETWVE